MVRVIYHRAPIDETGLADSTGVEGKVQPCHRSTFQRENAKTVSNNAGRGFFVRGKAIGNRREALAR
jgi:hypothetical protein